MTPLLDGDRRKHMAHNLPSGAFLEEINDVIHPDLKNVKHLRKIYPYFPHSAFLSIFVQILR
jgi:hypothetical protein